MHANGDQMYLQIKNSTGVVKRPNSVEYFDFGWQDSTLNEPFKIKPGDELTTRCYFNDNGLALFGVNAGSATDPTCSGGASTEFQPTTTATSTTTAVAKTDAPTHKTTFTSGVGGFTRETFNAAAQDAYKKVLGARLTVSPGNIAISGIVDATVRRRLAASGVKFDITVSVATRAIADQVATRANAELTGAATATFKTDLKAELVAASGVAFDDSAFDTFDVSSVTEQAVVIEIPASTGGDDNTGVVVGVACGAGVALVGLAALAIKKRKKAEKTGAMDVDVVASASPKDGPKDGLA